MTPSLRVIGSVRPDAGRFAIHVDEKYRKGLTGLAGFSHTIIFWLADRTLTTGAETNLICSSPYTATNGDIGVFASRSPDRPNPIGVSVVSITAVDENAGIIFTPFIDTLPETPLLDIKPYFPASDRADSATVPDHFSHWPQCLEESAMFDWASEFR